MYSVIGQSWIMHGSWAITKHTKISCVYEGLKRIAICCGMIFIYGVFRDNKGFFCSRKGLFNVTPIHRGYDKNNSFHEIFFMG